MDVTFAENGTVFPIVFDYKALGEFPANRRKWRAVLCLWWDDGNQLGGQPSFVLCEAKDYDMLTPITILLRRRYGNFALTYQTVQVSKEERDFIVSVCFDDEPVLTPPDDEGEAEDLPIMAPPSKGRKRKAEEKILSEIIEANEAERAPLTGSRRRPRSIIPNLVGRQVKWKQGRFYLTWPEWLKGQTHEWRHTIICGVVISQVNEGIPKCTIEFDDPSASAQENRYTLPLSNLLAELGE